MTQFSFSCFTEDKKDMRFNYICIKISTAIPYFEIGVPPPYFSKCMILDYQLQLIKLIWKGKYLFHLDFFLFCFPNLTLEGN